MDFEYKNNVFELIKRLYGAHGQIILRARVSFSRHLLEWSTRFSATCGEATKTRTRNCCTIFFGDRCNPIDQEFCTVETSLGILETGEDTKICDLEPCPYWSEWEEWSSCTKSCGSGTFSRGRTCCITEINQGTMNTDCFIDQTRCPGVQFEVQSCNEHFCMKIGNDTHPGKLHYTSYETVVVPVLVNGVVKFIIRLRGCAGWNYWRRMGIHLWWCVHIQACFQTFTFLSL